MLPSFNLLIPFPAYLVPGLTLVLGLPFILKGFYSILQGFLGNWASRELGGTSLLPSFIGGPGLEVPLGTSFWGPLGFSFWPSFHLRAYSFKGLSGKVFLFQLFWALKVPKGFGPQFGTTNYFLYFFQGNFGFPFNHPKAINLGLKGNFWSHFPFYQGIPNLPFYYFFSKPLSQIFFL